MSIQRQALKIILTSCEVFREFLASPECKDGLWNPLCDLRAVLTQIDFRELQTCSILSSRWKNHTDFVNAHKELQVSQAYQA